MRGRAIYGSIHHALFYYALYDIISATFIDKTINQHMVSIAKKATEKEMVIMRRTKEGRGGKH